MIAAVETSLEPPLLPGPVHEESDVEVSICITEADGTRRTASLLIPDPHDGVLADAMVACLRAVAALRGRSLVDSIELRLQ